MKTASTISRVDLDQIYTAIGRAIWHVQYAEDALNALITIKRDVGTPGKVTAQEASNLLKGHRRNTLGTSIRLARESRLVSDALLQQLMWLKNERDWIVHRSQYSVGDAVLKDSGRSNLVLRLDTFVKESAGITAMLMEEMRGFVAAEGHDVVIAERFNALKRADPVIGA